MGIYHSENLLKPKMSSSDETLFITQSTFTCDSNADGPMFDFINPDFSDISDSQLVFRYTSGGAGFFGHIRE